MGHDVRHSALAQAVPELLANLSDLIQKELRLARAEINRGLVAGIQAGIWIGVAAFLILIATVLVAEAIVFAIASFGIALHWSCLLVAVLFALAGGLCFYYGRTNIASEAAGTRTIKQFNATIKTAKEQLT
jgi:hypothetical protein